MKGNVIIAISRMNKKMRKMKVRVSKMEVDVIELIRM
jgi:hypothetical protein